MRDSFFRKIVLPAILFLSFTAAGQTIPESVAEFFEQVAEDGSTHNLEELLEFYENLRRHPVRINVANRQQLESLGVFSVFQVESLMDYRREYGEVLSLEELALVDGFSRKFVQMLAPYIVLDSEIYAVPQSHCSLRLRYTPGMYYGKVDGSFKGFSCNFTGCFKDKFLYSGALGWSSNRFKIVAGDFSPRFGQGLLLWKGFAMNSALGTETVMRRASGVVPYKGTDSSAAFRGLGASFSVSDRFKITSVFGIKASGVNFSLKGEHYMVGISGLADYSSAKGFSDWKSLHPGVSVDGVFSLGHLRLFSECAYNKAFAAVAGAVYSHSYNFETSILVRYYPAGYDASFSGAYSTLSKAANQHGVTLKMLVRPSGKLLLQASADYSYHPGPRYRIPVPSSVAKTVFRGEYSPSVKWMAYSQWNFAFKSYEQTLKNDIRLGAKVSVTGWLDLQARGDCCLLFMYDVDRKGYELQKGFAAFSEASFHVFRGKLLAIARLTAYSTDGYQTRIYHYENDLPQSFSIPFYYGKGISWYVLVRYKYRKGSGLCLKLSPKGIRTQIDLEF